jgi:hypothetical protein
MGKFKMSHGSEKVSLQKSKPEIVQAALDPEMKAMVDRVLENHKDTFERLAKLESQEKQVVREVVSEKQPILIDSKARQHTIAARIEAREDLNKHKQMMNVWMGAQSSQLKALDEECDKAQLQQDIINDNLFDKIAELQARKPQEIQIVKEVSAQKEIPKSIYIVLGVLFLMNVLTIVLK